MALRFLRSRRRRDVACQQAVELVTAYLEGQLSNADRARLEAHLAACPHCTEYVRQMRTTIAVLGQVTPPPVDAATRDELVALYRQWRAG